MLLVLFLYHFLLPKPKSKAHLFPFSIFLSFSLLISWSPAHLFPSCMYGCVSVSPTLSLPLCIYFSIPDLNLVTEDPIWIRFQRTDTQDDSEIRTSSYNADPIVIHTRICVISRDCVLFVYLNSALYFIILCKCLLNIFIII